MLVNSSSNQLRGFKMTYTEYLRNQIKVKSTELSNEDSYIHYKQIEEELNWLKNELELNQLKSELRYRKHMDKMGYNR